MQGGFRPALRVQLGSIIGDLTWCLAALIGLAPLMQIAWVRWLLGAVGVLLLVYLGALGVRDAMRPAALQPVTAGVVRSGAFRWRFRWPTRWQWVTGWAWAARWLRRGRLAPA
jgi:threonine/homoserine/homoserine lactone efflux protein